MKGILVLLLVIGVLATSCASSAPKQVGYSAAPAATAAAAQSPPVTAQTAETEILTTTSPDITPVISVSDVPVLIDTQGIVAAETPRLTLDIVSVTSPVKRGESATLKAQTLAGARCSISVYYKTVRSGLESLNEKTSEASGSVSWTWKTGTDLAPGSYRIEVVSRLGEKSESKTVYFTVI
jgi:hypothetical protein